MSDHNFENLLLEAVDEGLSSLSDSSKKVIYFHLEKTFKVNRQDIPHKIEEFAQAIEKIFGFGAKVLEIQIMKCIYKKIGVTIEYPQKPENLVFSEYVEATRQTFLKKEKQEHTCKIEAVILK